MTYTATFPRGTILGYPRIGRRRELKKAVEAFWGGEIGAAELEARHPCARQLVPGCPTSALAAMTRRSRRASPTPTKFSTPPSCSMRSPPGLRTCSVTMAHSTSPGISRWLVARGSGHRWR
jgi:hypothetical protein